MPSKKPPALAPLSRRQNLLAPTVPGTPLEAARLLPLRLIDPNPQQSRQVFHQEALDELAASIAEHGVLEPILVRPLADRYQVVAGERRTRAARQAGLTDIPAIVREMTDEEAGYVTAIENLQREDLDIEDEARWFAYLQDLAGLSGRELARRLGKGYNYINRRLALLERPDLLARLRAGELTQREALVQLSDGTDSAEVIHGVSEPDAGAVMIHRVSGEVERAELDAGTAPPSPPPFRWRPVQRFATWLDRARPQDVPAEERATLRAQLAQMRARLEAWEQALDEDRPA